MKSNKAIVRNYKLVFLAVVLLFFWAIFRLADIALTTEVDGMNISAFSNSIKTVEKTLYASRGNILDSSGELLAETVNSYTVIAYLEESRTEDENNPRHVVDKQTTAKLLAEILNLDESSLLESLNKDLYQVELKRNITELTKSRIEELELAGIDFVNSVTRYYQLGTFASYLVGYAKTDEEGEITGELGIEGYYNDILKGVDGKTEYQQAVNGYKIANVPEYTTPAVSGSDIYLTIDSNIQLIAENAIAKINKANENEWSIFTVMDAKTGAIVASATSPSYNPNDLNTIESYLNPLVSYAYEPGSTMKTFSFGAALEEGIYDGKETFKSGSIVVADATIKDYNTYGWGDITYDTGYAYSSNVATTLLALELGNDTLTSYYNNLGFGSKTGIELSSEVNGEIDFYWETELANASFGQGITTSPIQLLQAYSSMTNDGTVIKPYIVDKIVDPDGNVTYNGEREEVAKVYSKETVDYMHNLMHDVVYNSTSSYWVTDNVTLMGKSGTAQIANPEGGYLEGDSNTIRSFAGIFPEENPEYIVYTATSKFKGTTSDFSAIVTSAIEEIASYAKITTEAENEVINEQLKIDNFYSDKTSDVQEILEDKKLVPIIIGDGKYVTNQYPLNNQILFEGDKVFIKTNSDNIIMPDIVGYSTNEVRTLANLIGIKINTKGYGYVISQSISPGTVVTKDMILDVTLE